MIKKMLFFFKSLHPIKTDPKSVGLTFYLTALEAVYNHGNKM